VDLNSPITELKGVGEELAKKLAILRIYTVNDLIENFPRRYEDYSNIVPIYELKPGAVTIEANITQIKGRYVRRGLHITEAIAADESGSVRLVWFNQPYRAAAVKHGQPYFIAGEYDLRRGRFSILNPACELVSNFPVNTARIIPIYRETKGLKSHYIRRLIREALNEFNKLPEHLPDWLIKEQSLVSHTQAASEMHFPTSAEDLELAKKRLGFEEVFELSLAALLNKYELAHEHALLIPFREKLAKDFVASLPFTLTDAQRKVVWTIYKDMSGEHTHHADLSFGEADRTVSASGTGSHFSSPLLNQRTSRTSISATRGENDSSTQMRTSPHFAPPMNRLVEGDVGSGKTVVAAMAAIMAMEQNFQVAFMAPTEILARQHADTLFKLLNSVNYGGHVGLLIGGMTAKQKEQARERIASGDIRLIVGTHALITEKVDMHNLGLIIIDEQHRFGVDQRKKLQAKAGHMPHVLHMTATPIPRSLALTLYGELDISIIDEMPPGRQPIETKLVSPNSRKQLYEKIDKELEAGRQMFVVCPLITDSETSEGKSVEEVYEKLVKDFKHRKVGMLHGQMKSKEKDGQMQKFVNKEYDILVSTTVIEVGVDVPNASVMLIEGAERFGLAQIHQLRGRVGRGAHQSYCYLMLSDSKAPSPRLGVLESTTDGFKLAELDLRLRGPGAIYGLSQHGALDLRVASLSDTKLIYAARTAAQKFIDKKENLKKYPELAKKVTALRAITNLN
jgi:ATP-dependent DNA helicase RecG